MRIKVTKYYSGFNTGNKTIEEGIYQVGDERLCGIEDYLVSVQHKAEYLDDEVIEPDMVKDEVEDEPIITATQSHPKATEIEHKGRKVKVNPSPTKD